MSITLYELSATETPKLFSPHCWKSRLALAHKGLDFRSEAVCFTQKEKIEFSGQPLLPVLQYNNQVISDSWIIALFLEEQHPELPSLLGDKSTQQEIETLNQWAGTALSRHVPPIILLDIHTMIREEDRTYFRETREARVGKTLEACCENPAVALNALIEELSTLGGRLVDTPYLNGNQPLYGDTCVLSTILWVEISQGRKILTEGHALYHWYHRMLEVYSEAISDSASV